MNIQTDFDFLFLTYIQPKHRNPTINDYPSSDEIASEIKNSGYNTYFNENIKQGIVTFQDKEIIKLLGT